MATPKRKSLRSAHSKTLGSYDASRPPSEPVERISRPELVLAGLLFRSGGQRISHHVASWLSPGQLGLDIHAVSPWTLSRDAVHNLDKCAGRMMHFTFDKRAHL